jgi:hypothetical protein
MGSKLLQLTRQEGLGAATSALLLRVVPEAVDRGNFRHPTEFRLRGLQKAIFDFRDAIPPFLDGVAASVFLRFFQSAPRDS